MREVGTESLRERRNRLIETPGLAGITFCRAYAAEADDWLRGIANEAGGENPKDVALLAVGGYGRGEHELARRVSEWQDFTNSVNAILRGC